MRMRFTSTQTFTIKKMTILVLIGSVLLSTAQAQSASCHVYQVTLQGATNIGNATSSLAEQGFSLQEYAVWRQPGFKNNQIEFFLTANQDLNASAQPGEIELMTNTRFSNNAGIRAAQYDLASVSMANVINFQFDPGASYILPSPNVFVAPGYGSVSGGLGGLCFLPNSALCSIVSGTSVLNASFLTPRTGTGYFYFPNGTIRTLAGEINLVGSSLDNPNFQGQYKASFIGNFVGDLECN
jgi:hypothetical protein